MRSIAFALSSTILFIPSGLSEDTATQIPVIEWPLKAGQSLKDSPDWQLLNAEAGAEMIKAPDRQLCLRLTGGARFRSIDASAYLPETHLEATWSITNGQGAMGFGFIDFKTSIYYYFYQDVTKGMLILQRGDGQTTEQLAEIPFSSSTTSGNFKMVISRPKRDQVHLSLSHNESALGEPVVDRPEQELGSTFQIYAGSSKDAEVLVYKISTIPGTSIKKGGSWFW
ncbi:MAG: hypothetical protein AAF558_08750 [Verrucomicrobiota bacterium]